MEFPMEDFVSIRNKPSSITNYMFENLAFSEFSDSSTSEPRETDEFVQRYLQRVSRPSCAHHENVMATLRCTNCKAYCCTASCKMEYHATHDVVSYETLVSEKWLEFNSTISALKKMIEVARSTDSTLKDTQASVIEAVQSVEREIANTFASMEKMLECKKHALLREVTKIRDDFISQCEDRAKQLSTLGQTGNAQIDSSLHSEMCHHDIVEKSADLLELCDTLEQHMNKFSNHSLLKPISEVPQLSVEWNTQVIQWLQNESLTLGSIQLHQQKTCFEKLQTFNARSSTDKKSICVVGACCISAPGRYFGDFLLTDVNNKRIKHISSGGKVVRCFVGGGTYQCHRPSCVRVFLSGEILVSDPSTNKLVLFNENSIAIDSFGVDACEDFAIETESTPSAAVTSPQSPPASARFHLSMDEERFTSLIAPPVTPAYGASANSVRFATAKVVVLNTHEKILERISLRQGKLFKCDNDVRLHHNNQLSHPNRVEYNVISELFFISDTSEHDIFVFNHYGVLLQRTHITEQSTNHMDRFALCYPSALLCDKRGRVLVCDRDNHGIYVLNEGGTFLRPLPLTDILLHHPVSLCFDEKYNLVVVQQDGVLHRISYAPF